MTVYTKSSFRIGGSSEGSGWPGTTASNRLHPVPATGPRGRARHLTDAASAAVQIRVFCSCPRRPLCRCRHPLAQPRERGSVELADQPGQAADRGAGTRLARRSRGTVLRVLYLVLNEGYSRNVDLAAEAMRLTLPHPAARQPVSRHSLDYCAFRDSSGSSGCMVSSSDLGGDGSGGRGVGDRRAWSGTGQLAALPDRAAVTDRRPRSGGRASAWRRLAVAAVPGLWRPGAGLRPARGGWSRPA